MCSHPNIVDLIGAYVPSEFEQALNNKTPRPFILTELVSESLRTVRYVTIEVLITYQAIQTEVLPLNICLSYSYQIARGIRHLQRLGISHRPILPDFVVVCSR